LASVLWPAASLGAFRVGQASAPGPASIVWINWERWNLLAGGLLLCGIMAACMRRAARRPPQPGRQLRPLPGVAAIGDAIAQAARSEKPVLLVTGSEDLNDIQTLAGLSILEQVAMQAAAQGADLRVPHLHSLTMTAADSILQRAYAAAGRPESYDSHANYYVSDEQFGFVAGVDGMMCRDRPGACLYFGSFYAESLALAEVGRGIGAMQIAGTGQPSQIPFLLAACDHVLIGEELFAVSAYLSQDPRQLGSLRGQDFGKLVAIAAVVLGCLLATWAELTDSATAASLRSALLKFFGAG
jgi:hypothetical protein